MIARAEDSLRNKLQTASKDLVSEREVRIGRLVTETLTRICRHNGRKDILDRLWEISREAYHSHYLTLDAVSDVLPDSPVQFIPLVSSKSRKIPRLAGAYGTGNWSKMPMHEAYWEAREELKSSYPQLAPVVLFKLPLLGEPATFRTGSVFGGYPGVTRFTREEGDHLYIIEPVTAIAHALQGYMEGVIV